MYVLIFFHTTSEVNMVYIKEYPIAIFSYFFHTTSYVNVVYVKVYPIATLDFSKRKTRAKIVKMVKV